VAVNRPLDPATAEAIARLVIEIVVAPEADPEAAAILARRPALRLLVAGAMPHPKAVGREFRSLAGGILVQQSDTRSAAAADLRIVTRRAPSAAETADLLFADTIAKHVKSNAIVFAKDGATVGIGAGQMSRVDAAKIAVAKALDMQRAAGAAAPPTEGAVMASDAFFPFADGLEAGINAGITAVIQPGGSRRDAEIVAAADRAGIAMVFTGLRHFRH
jgi:phosphoribosylaminoimidazolecarboxamide formyltransferase/IMP cyclohydrolase